MPPQITTLILHEATRPDPIGNDVGKYTWNLNKVIGVGKSKVQLKIRYIGLWYTWYTFKNEVLYYNDGIPKTITLNGNFTSVTLPPYIQGLLGGGYTVTISASLGTITILSPGPVTWNIGTTPWSVRSRYFLGAGEDDIASVANSSTFPFPVKLGGDQLIQIATNGIVGYNENRAKGSKLLGDSLKIPIKYNPGYMIEYTPEDFFTIITSETNSSPLLEFTFLDQFGKQLDLNGGDAFFQLEMS